jgi:molybdopterin converting factor small subunit
MLKLLCFARWKEIVGGSTLALNCSRPIRLAELRELLTQRFPACEHLLVHTLFTRGTDFLTEDTMLEAGDEIALIPPVSGG